MKESLNVHTSGVSNALAGAASYMLSRNAVQFDLSRVQRWPEETGDVPAVTACCYGQGAVGVLSRATRHLDVEDETGVTSVQVVKAYGQRIHAVRL